MIDLTPSIDTLTRTLERSNADPVRIDRTELATLRDTLCDLRVIFREPSVHLTATERAIYHALSLANGQLVTFEELVEAINSRSIKSLWVHIRRLREKLDTAGEGEEIDTIRSRGYLLRRSPWTI